MKDSNFSRDFKKDFKTIYSRIEKEKKINSSKDFENVFTKIFAKMNALWSSTMVRVLNKFEKTNSELINFSIKFDFRSYEKAEKIENIYSTVVNQNREALNGL